MATLSNFSTTFDPLSSVPVFGSSSPKAGVYPNDTVLLDIYNYTNDYLETQHRATHIARNSYNISIDVEKELQQLQYYSGKYNITARFLRNHLGSADGDKLVIQEISSDRLEVRVTPVQFLTNQDNNFIDFFQSTPSGFFSQDKKEVLPNLYVFKDDFTTFKVFDYVQDPFTFPDAPFSIIFKLTSPISNDIRIDDLIWIAQEISEPIKDSVTVIPPKRQLNQTRIAGPNFDIVTSRRTSQASDYRNWDDVLSTNTQTSLDVVNKLFSGSLIEGIDLNIDFRDFNNFIHFGSAEERVRNFQYKLELLEYYDSRIYLLSESYQNFPASASLTGSMEFVGNILDAKTKKSNILGGFDLYEKYLYYESSSYVSNSFGEFYPTTWPKTNNTKPYINYSTTSSQAVSWFNGAVASASVYDLNNANSLRKIVPEHIYANNANDQYILFIDMIGHYFDLIYAYINQLTNVNKRYESLTEGFAKELVYTIGQSLGIRGENGAVLEELWSYFLGKNVDGSLTSTTYGISVEDRTKEVWKRVIANLPYLLKTKGTARGIRALINCYGIPSTILRVREFGGPEPTWGGTSREEYDQFYYGLYLSGSSTSISAPVVASIKALEIRFRLHSSSLNANTNFEVLTGPTTITANPFTGTVVADGQTISNVPLSETDTDWWTVLVNDGGRSYIGTNKYGKALIYSSSTAAATLGTTAATIPGATRLNGYVNEFRVWSQNLDLQVYENHILAPTSFQGPQDDFLAGSTSSFDTLKVRHTFGADGKKFDASVTTSIASSHPNQSAGMTTATLSNFGSNTASYWIPQVETHYIEVVDGGATRNIGNKVRIEQGVVSASNQLQRNSSVLDSLQDYYPVDSPRVGVYFSPTDEINEDINEQFGGIHLDDFLGDPADYYNQSYTGLDKLNNDYFKKFRKRNDTQGFIRLVQNYDSSLFQLVKQFVPERAILHTGVAIESHILHRSKVGNKQPSVEELQHDGSFQTVPTTGGDILPLSASLTNVYEWSGESNYLEGETSYTTTLNSPETAMASVMEGTSATSVDNIEVLGSLNEYNNDSVLELDEVIQVGYGNPSQYAFYNWFQTGSGPTDWVYSLSVGQDQWDPIQPTILQNAISDVYTTPIDRFGNNFTTSGIALLTGSGIDMGPVLRLYGLYSSLYNMTVITFQGEYVIQSSETS